MSRASGVGSWPGADVRQAVAAVRDLLSEDGLPYLPELPARGPGADIIGRSAGLLADLAVDLQPMGWRFVDRPGRDAHRTSGLMRQDLDELAEAFDGYAGDLKVQIAGPWTLASSVWLHRGERSVVDAGATRDVVAAAGDRHTVVHCCAPEVPFVLLRDTGVKAVSVDVALLSPKGWESLAASVESGLALWAGVVPTDHADAGARSQVTDVIGPLVKAWRRVGLPVPDLSRVTLTPACGLAGFTPAGARTAQRLAVDAARALTETAGS